MNITFIKGTMRIQMAGEDSSAWPIYMPAPADIENPMVLSLAQELYDLLGEDTPDGRITGAHEPMQMVGADGSFRVDARTISPDDDATAETPEVQTALDVFYGPDRDSDYAKKYRAIQAEVIAEPQAEPLTPEQHKEVQRREIIAAYQSTMDSLQSGYTEQEVKTFAQKAREAEIILDGSDKPTPLIDALSAGLGVDRVVMAQGIADKVNALGAAAGHAEAVMEGKLAALAAQ